MQLAWLTYTERQSEEILQRHRILMEQAGRAR